MPGISRYLDSLEDLDDRQNGAPVPPPSLRQERDELVETLGMLLQTVNTPHAAAALVHAAYVYNKARKFNGGKRD